MKKTVIMKKLVAAAIIICMTILAILCEWGLANLFHIQYNGMGYREYAVWYFTEHPWVLYVEIAMMLGIATVWVNVEYREIDQLWNTIRAKMIKQ